MYPVSKGVYLVFDSENREYVGFETFFINTRFDNWVAKESDNLINELLRKGILEYAEN